LLMALITGDIAITSDPIWIKVSTTPLADSLHIVSLVEIF
jgi:hypothetical protein